MMTRVLNLVSMHTDRYSDFQNMDNDDEPWRFKVLLDRTKSVWIRQTITTLIHVALNRHISEVTLHGDTQVPQQQGSEQQTVHDVDAVDERKADKHNEPRWTDAADNTAAFNFPSTSPFKFHDVWTIQVISYTTRLNNDTQTLYPLSFWTEVCFCAIYMWRVSLPVFQPICATQDYA